MQEWKPVRVCGMRLVLKEVEGGLGAELCSAERVREERCCRWKGESELGYC